MKRATFLQLCGALPLLAYLEQEAQADMVKPSTASPVQPFDLADVRLLPGPFKDAQERDRAYLLWLEPDRLLHNFRANAGLPPKAAIYDGWESLGIAGHILGHYLSACAHMYRSTGDPEMKRRVDYIVDELALCQKAGGDGYVSAIPDGRKIFDKIAAGDGGAISQGWVPWYTMHKVYAGLRDAYYLCDSEKAKSVLVPLSDWAYATTHNLSDAEFQKMLDTEHGGMDEVMADVYAMTGDKRYLDLSRRFCHRRILDPLAQEQDRLDGFHANTQIPKVIGFARLYELTGDKTYGTASRFFWKTVVDNRTYAIGGNSDDEHFFPTRTFDSHLSAAACETCNTYNMLRLTRALFTQEPTAKGMDYYERALYNHILASQDPDSGMMTYFVSMKPGNYKVYSDPEKAFWCCVGTGIENHAKYGDSVYFHDDRSLWVNLFLASELKWKEKRLTVRQETRFPEQGSTRLTLTCAKPTPLALKVRYPGWAEGMTVRVNGKPIALADARPASYVTIDRIWRSGDIVEIDLPMHLSMEALPDSEEHFALLSGPVVLAGDLGAKNGPDILPSQTSHLHQVVPDVPGLVADRADVLKRIVPVADQPLTFRTQGLGRPGDVTLVPFYKLHHRHYTIYWGVYSPEEWGKRQAAIAAEQERQRAIEARTLDQFRPGEQQPEVDHHFQGERSRSGAFRDRHWRDADAGGWFSFDMKVVPDAPVDLVCTWWGGDSGNRVFDILVDGTTIAAQTLENERPGEFIDRTYPIPPELTRGKQAITVKLQAKPGKVAGGLFGCRTLRHTTEAATKEA